MNELQTRLKKYISPKAPIFPIVFLSVIELALLVSFILGVIFGDAEGGFLIFAIILGFIIYLMYSSAKKRGKEVAACFEQYKNDGTLDELLTDYQESLNSTAPQLSTTAGLFVYAV